MIINPNGHPRILAVDCGMKHNQIRCLKSRGARIEVVPWNHDLAKAMAKDHDGLFLSNGPGDPQMCAETVKNIKQVLEASSKPIFGICLGHQLMAVALGCKTKKMKYGNRGHNQPCIHEDTKRCYITTQNHGYAVDASHLPEGTKDQPSILCPMNISESTLFLILPPILMMFTQKRLVEIQ